MTEDTEPYVSAPPVQGRVDNPFQTSVAATPAGASVTALAQRETAEVQAAIVVAHRFPRDPKSAVDRILTACTRPSLAAVACYQYARGGTEITGPSIRLAEELARSWGNIASGVVELSRANGVSEVMAYAWDLETNTRDEKRFQVKHWRDTRSGGYQLRDERDIYELLANQAARRKRACILAVIPGDVVDRALEQCEITLKNNVDLTPERIRAMVDRFAEIGVSRAMVEKRIQRPVDSISAALMINLGRIYTSIKDGVAKAGDFFEPEIAAVPDAPATGAGVAGAKEAVRRARKQDLPISDERAEPPAEGG